MENNLEEEFLAEVETTIKTQKTKRKKGINSKRKGNSAENEVRKILDERFSFTNFHRSPSSGAFVGGSNFYRKEELNKSQNLVFVGDVYCSREDFKFTIEHKAYAEASFWDLFNESSDLHSWMKQAEHDAESVGKQPMLIVKYNFHERIIYVKKEFMEDYQKHWGFGLDPIFTHNGWECYWFKEFLNELPNNFFFEEVDNGE